MFNSRDPSLYISRSLFFFIQFIISFTGMRHRAFIMGLRLALLVYSNNSNLEMINVSSINSSQWLRRRHRRPPPVLPENEKNQLAWPGLAVSSLTSRWRLFTGSRSTTQSTQTYYCWFSPHLPSSTIFSLCCCWGYCKAANSKNTSTEQVRLFFALFVPSPRYDDDGDHHHQVFVVMRSVRRPPSSLLFRNSHLVGLPVHIFQSVANWLILNTDHYYSS